MNLKYLLSFLALVAASSVEAAEETAKVSEEMFTINNLWILLGAILVFQCTRDLRLLKQACAAQKTA